MAKGKQGPPILWWWINYIKVKAKGKNRSDSVVKLVLHSDTRLYILYSTAGTIAARFSNTIWGKPGLV